MLINWGGECSYVFLNQVNYATSPKFRKHEAHLSEVKIWFTFSKKLNDFRHNFVACVVNEWNTLFVSNYMHFFLVFFEKSRKTHVVPSTILSQTFILIWTCVRRSLTRRFIGGGKKLTEEVSQESFFVNSFWFALGVRNLVSASALFMLLVY